ncbi:retrotransposon protein, putative, ty1-copia subclass [Tanacetum coccineum]
MSCCSRDVVAKSMAPSLERSRHRNAPVAIIDRQLPFEYTIASRSTDVMVPISPALPTDYTTQVLTQWNAVYDVHNEVACLMLGKEGKLVSSYVLKMKGYVEQLELLGYVLPQNLSVGLINASLKGLPKKDATPQVMAIQGGRIQKANKKSLNAKGKGKGKDKSYIPKPKNPKPYAKEHPAKDDACHNYKEVGHCIFTIELISFPNKSWVHDTGCGTHICNTKHGLRGERKLKQGALYLCVGNGIRAQVKAIGSDDLVLPNGLIEEENTLVKSLKIISKLVELFTAYTSISPQHNWVSEKRNRTLLDMVRSMINLTTLSLSFWDYTLKTATRTLNMVSTKKGCEALIKRDTPDKLQKRSVKCIFIGYPKEPMGYYFYFPPENKIVVVRYAEFLEKNLISQKVSGRAEKLEEIQDKDTSPSENTSKNPMEVEGFKPP